MSTAPLPLRPEPGRRPPTERRPLADRRSQGAWRPDLRLVPQPQRRHRLLLVGSVVALCASAVFATVALSALAAGDAVGTRALERRVADAERRYEELVAEVARLEDPARIERVATEELGLVRAEGARFLVLRPALPQDAADQTEVAAGDRPDPLKPVLSLER